MFSICYRITNNLLNEINQLQTISHNSLTFSKKISTRLESLHRSPRNTLHSTTTGKTAIAGFVIPISSINSPTTVEVSFSHTLNVITKDFTMTLGNHPFRDPEEIMLAKEPPSQITNKVPFHLYHDQTYLETCYWRGELVVRIVVAES